MANYLSDFYASVPNAVATAERAVATNAPPNAFRASGSVSQSASGSVEFSGHPAAWFLALLAGVLILYHWEG